MLDPITHAISYAIFQTMFSLFLASPFSGTTAEGDYISIPPQAMRRLLEQPKVAGLRYYLTLNREKKMSAIVVAMDSNGTENRRYILNAKNAVLAERDILAFEAAGMVKKTGTKYGTIGMNYDDSGKIHYTQGKAEILSMAKTAYEIRAFYTLNPEKKNVVLVFTSASKTGMVLQSSGTTATATLLDNSFDCPPFCKNGGGK